MKNHEWAHIEYQTAFEGIKMLYDSFYKLATMSFAFNASLGTAVGLLTTTDADEEVSIFYLIISQMIALLGVFYNIAAIWTYGKTVNSIQSIALQIGELAHDVSNSAQFEGHSNLNLTKKIVQINTVGRSGNRKTTVEILISGVLQILTAIWLVLFVMIMITLSSKLGISFDW